MDLNPKFNFFNPSYCINLPYQTCLVILNDSEVSINLKRVLNSLDFFTAACALQPVRSLYANALCSKRQGFFCHTEALAEVSINLRRVLNSVDFSPFCKRLKMTNSPSLHALQIQSVLLSVITKQSIKHF